MGYILILRGCNDFSELLRRANGSRRQPPPRRGERSPPAGLGLDTCIGCVRVGTGGYGTNDLLQTVAGELLKSQNEVEVIWGGAV